MNQNIPDDRILNPGDLKDLSPGPQRIHHSAFEAAADSAERLGLPMAAQVLRESARRALDAGGWLE